MTWLKLNWFKIVVIVILVLVLLTMLGSSENKRIASRKDDCLAIYKAEPETWGSAFFRTRWNYDQDRDVCQVVFLVGKETSKDLCGESADPSTIFRIESNWGKIDCTSRSVIKEF